ncbi:hypothetical protein ON010_g1642 [Phytophthora cinnamomi]|nr:hypothetical protein ON010_g1642 [Phytophthora cinnamomi]
MLFDNFGQIWILNGISDIFWKRFGLFRSRPKPSLCLRLSCSPRSAATDPRRSINQVRIQELHRRLDVIFETLGVEDSTQWRAEWDAGCAQQLQELKRLASRSPFVLANEVGGDKKLREALISLSSTFNMDQDPELLQLGRDSFDRVIKAKRMHGLKIFEWFISGDDIDYEDEAIGAVGTFAEARRGTWFHDGERQDVVVKTLLFNTEGEDEENFHRQLAIWYGLSDHPNVLKLKGGNPFSSPPFFVCENAPNGNLLDFLADESNEGFFWSLFLDVARGIQYLHSQRIVHGSLKAVNILVTGDNTAKIADFGFSRIRTISLSLSDKGSKALSAAIRWKPKEQLEESASDGPQFASDLYALGMSMLEVVTQESPFGTLDDDTVTDLVLNGKLPPRPEQASDDAWDLILKLCASDFRDRPGIDDVIDTLTLFQT